MRGATYTRDNVKLREARRGQWCASAGGHAFEVLLLDGSWVVFVDGVERFSAFRLAVAHEKIVEWLAGRER